MSEDKEFMIKFRFKEPVLPIVDVVASQYISCIYDHSPWIGVVLDVDLENHDVLIKVTSVPFSISLVSLAFQK